MDFKKAYGAVVGWLLYHPLLFALVVLASFVGLMWLFYYFAVGKNDDIKTKRTEDSDET
jgi:multidrug efflux pump subunit AcrB